MSLLFFFCLKIENILDVLNPKHDHLAYQTWENGKLEEMSNGKDGAGEGGGDNHKELWSQLWCRV